MVDIPQPFLADDPILGSPYKAHFELINPVTKLLLDEGIKRERAGFLAYTVCRSMLERLSGLGVPLDDLLAWELESGRGL